VRKLLGPPEKGKCILASVAVSAGWGEVIPVVAPWRPWGPSPSMNMGALSSSSRIRTASPVLWDLRPSSLRMMKLEMEPQEWLSWLVPC
ncbi:chaperonin containing TCP1 subunit 5, partial [Homo sapiens]